MAMRRSDRRDSNDDNAINHLRSRQKEPTPPHELKQLLMTVRAQRDEWQQKAKKNEEAVSQLVDIQQKIQTYQLEANQSNERATQIHQLYLDEQEKHKQTICLYNEEKNRAIELLAKYEVVNSERERYLSLYNDAQAELKHERRSKASIKGWETRRKTENEKLKREIAEMIVILHKSWDSNEEATNKLHVVSERMDRIQSLLDSADEETTSNPIGLIQKFKRIWIAIKEIISE
jgi:chromosome segregation ATPase